jgi:hypothetical protein
MTFQSPRGIPLVAQAPGRIGVLTVENYLKWYTLYLIQPDGSVEPVPFPEEGHTDHVPHPDAVAALAEEKGWIVCSESMEMIIGRYMQEVQHYEPEDLPQVRRYPYQTPPKELFETLRDALVMLTPCTSTHEDIAEILAREARETGYYCDCGYCSALPGAYPRDTARNAGEGEGED